MYRLFASALVLSAGMSATALAIPPESAREIYQKVTPSLVAVQYTIDGEFGRRELTGQGIIVSPEGLVMTSMALFPTQVPDEQLKEFKIILPGDQEQEFDAVFLGRDERTDLAFLKAVEPQQWQAVEFEQSDLHVAQTVASVGLLPKDAGYRAYYSEAFVSSLLRGPVPYVLVGGSGLTTVGSPVFNSDGKAIGFVGHQPGQNIFLAGGPTQQGAQQSPLAGLTSPPRLFVPASDFMLSLQSPPAGEPLELPWLGAALTGLSREVAEFFDLRDVPVAQVGDLIPDGPAARAGLQTRDKIIRINGENLARGDEPEETPRILNRTIRRMAVGEEVTLTVLRERGQPTIDLVVTLEEQPMPMNRAARFFAEDLGMSMRQIVFADTYAKRLPADTQGVIVSFVRPASSAASANLRPGDLVTELNSRAVESLEDFQTRYQTFRRQSPRESVVLVVLRDGNTQVIRIEPPQ